MNNKDGFTITKQTKRINEYGEYTFTEEKTVARYDSTGYLYKNRTEFLKSFLDEKYPDELSWADKGRLGRLEHEIKENQMLVYKSNNMIKPHNVKTISKMLGFSERQAKAFINKCFDYGILGEAKIQGAKYLFFNPRYRLYGNRLTLITWTVFQSYFKESLPRWAYNCFLEDFILDKPDLEVISHKRKRQSKEEPADSFYINLQEENNIEHPV